MSTHKSFSRKAWRPVGVLVGALVALAACSSLLDVKNPNDVTEDALDNPAAAANITNGVLAALARMLSGTTTPYAVATDELDWTGSRDAWLELETGAISDHFNEFSDGAFPFVGEARFLGDNAITRLKAFDAAGQLTTRANLANAQLYTAVVYASIADMYDDYAFSTKTLPSAPIGRANMGTLYDKAVTYLDDANTIAQTAAGTAAQRFNILAYRARVKHAKAAWAKVTPKSATPPANPLVSDAGAVADATAAIALATGDQTFTIANSIGSAAGINIWFEVNGRNENGTGVVYRNLIDPVTGAKDIRATALLAAFAASGTQAGNFTLTSLREMRLILAENALATGNAAEVVNQINLVRGLDAGRTAWNGVTPTPRVMLEHERQVQLWLMRRRLIDMARFGKKDAKWAANPNYESTFGTYGLLFPIPQVERLGNPCVNDAAAPGC